VEVSGLVRAADERILRAGHAERELRLRYGRLEAGVKVILGGEAARETTGAAGDAALLDAARLARAEIADWIADDIGGVGAGRPVMRDPARATADRPLDTDILRQFVNYSDVSQRVFGAVSDFDRVLKRLSRADFAWAALFQFQHGIAAVAGGQVYAAARFTFAA